MKALPLFLSLLVTTAMAFVPRSTSTAFRVRNPPFSSAWPLFGVFETLSGAAELLGAFMLASEDGKITTEELNTLNSALRKITKEELNASNSAIGKIQKNPLNPVIPILQVVLNRTLSDSGAANFESGSDDLEYDTYPEHPEVSHRSISWPELHIYSTHSVFAVSQRHFRTHDEDGERSSAPVLFLLSKEVYFYPPAWRSLVPRVDVDQ
jgi:hypothetical protein